MARSIVFGVVLALLLNAPVFADDRGTCGALSVALDSAARSNGDLSEALAQRLLAPEQIAALPASLRGALADIEPAQADAARAIAAYTLKLRVALAATEACAGSR